MANYITPEYSEIEEELKPFINEHQIDKVTASSLIRGCIEVIEPEMPIASVTVLKPQDLSSAVSVKPRNIKVNLMYAFDLIFFSKSICDADGIWLILMILKVIVSLLKDMEINLGKQEASVLYCLYRLRYADSNEIVDYAEKLKDAGENVEIHNECIEPVLDKLEQTKILNLENGKYCLCETVWIRK